jgi:uncharacterized protein YdeI (YjbR/CyaY-like superfamily)
VDRRHSQASGRRELRDPLHTPPASQHLERCEHPAGLAAFQARRENRSGKYSYEQRRDRFDEPYQGMLRQDEAAWAFFQAQPASYRKTAVWYVVSAKKEETRLKRLKSLIHECKNGRRII